MSGRWRASWRSQDAAAPGLRANRPRSPTSVPHSHLDADSESSVLLGCRKPFPPPPRAGVSRGRDHFLPALPQAGAEPRPQPSQGHLGPRAFHSSPSPPSPERGGSSRPPPTAPFLPPLRPTPHTPPGPSRLSPGAPARGLRQSRGDSAGTRRTERGNWEPPQLDPKENNLAAPPESRLRDFSGRRSG